MISPEIRQAILALRQKGTAQRRIAKLLQINRKTVQRVLSSCPPTPTPHDGAEASLPQPDEPSSQLAPELLEAIPELFARCAGNAVRVREELQRSLHRDVPYSTLTRTIRELGLRRPSRPRAGSYPLGPGEEMQHDTSPHKLAIAGKPLVAQCAGLTLAYSRLLFVQYYPRFSRFEAKCFLADAFAFVGGVCPRVVIDNTRLFVATGAGPNAGIAPEMVAFGALFGLAFVPHAPGQPDRKARIERAFHFIEHNFLAGRDFASWSDLNTQARTWCAEVANRKPKRSLRMSPEAALVRERPYLQPLPLHVPPVFTTTYRIADQEGYVSLDTIRYSVPERLVGKQLELRKLASRVQVFFHGRLVAEHARVLDARDTRVTDPAHHAPLARRAAHQGPCPEELALSGKNPTLDRFVALLKSRSYGRAVLPLRKLLSLYRSYPERAFRAAIQQALAYGLTDLHRVESLILSRVTGDPFRFPNADDDEEQDR
jgi:hypothetical protein